ncbi:MAG: hypothetical protein ACHQUC_04210 [Chlamydiales bacterium]
MTDEGNSLAENLSSKEEMELYGDPGIASYDAKIPKFLIWTYILLPILGVFVLVYFFNGSAGWLDRGYWYQLQIAANTTMPYENQNLVAPENSVQVETAQE